MNVYSKIAEGLAAWLSFERRLWKRKSFLREVSCSSTWRSPPVSISWSGASGVEHSVLAHSHTGVGKKPRFDFTVDGPRGVYRLVVEVKWASQSSMLLRDILGDIVRLDLLLGYYAQDAVLVLAGEKRTIAKLFGKPQFQPWKEPSGNGVTLPYRGSRHLLPLGEKQQASLRFAPVPEFRRLLFVRALRPFYNVSVSRLVQVERSGPFPRSAASRDYGVYLWRVKRISGKQFMPNEEYAELKDAFRQF